MILQDVISNQISGVNITIPKYIYNFAKSFCHRTEYINENKTRFYQLPKNWCSLTNEQKNYVILNIISILGTFYNSNIILGFKLSINFLITDLKYQLYIKKKYKKKIYKHEQFLKNNCRISNDWFSSNIPIWSNLFETYKLNKKSLNVQIGRAHV